MNIKMTRVVLLMFPMLSSFSLHIHFLLADPYLTEIPILFSLNETIVFPIITPGCCYLTRFPLAGSVFC
jgi:hypothetical protein